MTQELNIPCTTDPGGAFQGVNAPTWFSWNITNKFIHCTPTRIALINRRYWGVSAKNQNTDCSFVFYVKVNSGALPLSLVNVGFCKELEAPKQEKNFIGVQVYYRNHSPPFSPTMPFSISSVLYDSLGQLDAGSVGPLNVAYMDQWLRVECSYISKTFTVRVYDSTNILISTVTVILTAGRTFATDIFALACSTVDTQNFAMNMDVKNITADRYSNAVEIKNSVLKSTYAKAGI